MVNIRDVSLFPNTATWLFPGADSDSVPAARALPADSMVDSLGSDYPLVVIVGPTASGKSALAVNLGECFEGEIVNYDSVQLYRGFDIGSGKPLAHERRGVPHHLIDVAEPSRVLLRVRSWCAHTRSERHLIRPNFVIAMRRKRS